MSASWFKNLLGMKVTDEEMQNIPYPSFELGIHITMKDVQAFTILGMGIIGPLVAVVRGHRSAGNLRQAALNGGKYGAATGLVVGPLMTYGRIRNLEQDGIFDRCYRLRHNEGQVRVDRLSIFGGLGGTGLGVAMGHGALSGGLVGMTAGVLVGGVYNNFIKNKL
ncbi:uncharacterized protein LOC106463262 [Limulus polyphemus]|uniref:Uncharacterized protein LOC106463262 n=1 Tax=Limulus polyphemus TaxID=6850 RepID=A0ABM1BBL8_LIMPO|nr:uncharacterized protein LOC106463262 [Limulus polyphemus]XP_013778729.1 uncharacterized protein LOC106463262 [Limulus polyphemus]XP_013778731.1 uncharacterized protein LOC106463262 [Limulus polyphemus]XP_013778732.1 uncharacterized protein LOC106463262 [Limulus polyphemus]XP_022246414.1 uncharacterized protein LOC106463262 [Limulus polyphemus]XP_022246415.1 uncharacterized protein LOC106463262 [Limulus polyphemus]